MGTGLTSWGFCVSFVSSKENFTIDFAEGNQSFFMFEKANKDSPYPVDNG